MKLRPLLLFGFLACLTVSRVVDAELKLPASECSFAGSFEQSKSITGIDQPLTSSGTFYYHCRHGVIWATVDPVTEVLTVTREGRGHFDNGEGSKPLKSRQGRFLGGLLNGLMSGDEALIARQFTVEELDQSGRYFRLLPKKRSLKRAIKSVTVTIPEDDKLGTEDISIDIVDRNQQSTEIRSRQSEVFNAEQQALPQCLSVQELIAASCALLFESETDAQ